MVLDSNFSNFFAIIIKGIKRPYIIYGKGLKSLLRKCLKKIATLQNRLEGAKKKGFKIHLLEERLSKTWLKLKRILRHLLSNLILELALKYAVKKIYIGDAVKNKNKESNLNGVVEQIWSLFYYTEKLKSIWNTRLKIMEYRLNTFLKTTLCGWTAP